MNIGRHKFEPRHDRHQLKLNLGCGRDVRRGYVNLDKCEGPGVQVVADVEANLLSMFKDDQFDYILARDFLNHLPHRSRHFDGEFWDLFIDDMIRVTRPYGTWELIHPCRPSSLENGGHCRIVGVGSFNYWLTSGEMLSLEADSRTGGLSLVCKENLRAPLEVRASFWRVVLEVVK